MGKIYNFFNYDFSKDEKYTEEIEKAVDLLIQMEEDLTTSMINIACQDKWKEWFKTQKGGSEFSFSDEMLAQTGDDTANELFMLREDVREKIKKIQFINKMFSKE
jgi:hypothetical protein